MRDSNPRPAPGLASRPVRSAPTVQIYPGQRRAEFQEADSPGYRLERDRLQGQKTERPGRRRPRGQSPATVPALPGQSQKAEAPLPGLPLLPRQGDLRRRSRGREAPRRAVVPFRPPAPPQELPPLRERPERRHPKKKSSSDTLLPNGLPIPRGQLCLLRAGKFCKRIRRDFPPPRLHR